MAFFYLLIVAVWLNTVCKLIVRAPKELVGQFQNGTLNVSLGNFGMIPYGHTIVGKLFFSPDVDGELMGCNPFNLLEVPENPRVDESPIIMVDRGKCSFVTKARNIEKANGHVALIVNSNNDSVHSIIMADDGRGAELTIPALLISWEDGDKLKKFWNKYRDNPSMLKKIVLEVDFEMENSNNFVEYDIWYTPDQEQVYKLIGDFYVYHMALQNHSRLNIHIVTVRDFTYAPSNPKETKNCLGGGLYCIPQRSFGEEGKPEFNGAAVLLEGIMQKCIYKYSYKENKQDLFWKYMQYFYYDCFKKGDFSHLCSMNSIQNAGIDSFAVTKCYSESFKTKNANLISNNTVLDEENEERQKWLINRVPSLFVNQRQFLSSWRGEFLFEGICAALKKKPDICYIDGYFSKDKKMSGWTFFFIVLLIIFINVVIFYFCIRFIRVYVKKRLESSDLEPKINSVVYSYFDQKETTSQ